MSKQIIGKLKEAGFKANIHGDAFDRGDYRVYFDDIDLNLVKFNNPKSQLVEWSTPLTTNMPEAKLLNAIEALTA